MGILDAPVTPNRLVTARAKALQPAFAGLGNRDFTGSNWVFIGTSMTEGGPGMFPGQSGKRRFRWLDRLQYDLRNRFPLIAPVAGSTGYIPAFYQSFNAGGTGATGAILPTGVTQSGTLTAYNSGLGNRSHGLTTTADWKQFTFTGDSCDLFMSTHTGITPVVQIAVDGVNEGTTRTLSGTTLTSARYAITGLTAGSHTVRVTYVSGGPAVVDGLMPYNGDRTSGIQVWDSGKGSSKVGDFATDTTNRVWQPFGLIQPSLIGVEFGYNEYFGNVPPATFQTNLTNAVGWMRNKVTVAPSMLFIIWPEPIVSGGQGTAGSYSAYCDVVSAVAAATPNGLVCDLRQALRSPKVDTTQGVFYTDGVHFTEKGAAAAGDAILDFLISGSRAA